jgi:hypothetical protein
MIKSCIKCFAEFKDESLSQKRKICDLCISNRKKEYGKKYYIDNKETIINQSLQNYELNKPKILAQAHDRYLQDKENILHKNKLRYDLNKDEYNEQKRYYYKINSTKFKKLAKEYRQNNKELVRKWSREWEISKKKDDPSFKLRKNISRLISYYLFQNDSSKNGVSMLSKLEYSFAELKNYLENLFEPWMTWENYGVYRVDTWDDNDSSTWTWQLDHIIPQSKLLYSSMDDDNFNKCWALSNLRPLSAKLNLIKGNR